MNESTIKINNLTKKVFFTQLALFLFIRVLIGFIYIYQTIIMTAWQFKWFLFLYSGGALIFGSLLMIMPLIWLKPINRFLADFRRNKLIAQEEINKIQNLILKYPLKTTILIFSICGVIGPSIFIFLLTFLKVSSFELLKIALLSVTVGILFSLFSYFNLERILRPVVEFAVLKGGKMKKNYFSIFSKAIFISVMIAVFSLTFTTTVHYADIRYTLLLLILTIFAALIFAFFLSLLFARSVSVPIKELARIADLVAEKGDLEQKIVFRTNDEVGLLAESLDQMITKLRENQEELKRTNIELEKRVKERLGPYQNKIKELEEKIEELERTRNNLENKLKGYM